MDTSQEMLTEISHCREYEDTSQMSPMTENYFTTPERHRILEISHGAIIFVTTVVYPRATSSRG